MSVWVEGKKPFRELVLEKIWEFGEASPVGKITIIIQLRTMFGQCTIEEGLSAIDMLQDEKALGLLLGVGMRGAFYYAVVRRRGEILGL